MRIVVTGGSGKAGRWVVRDLRDHGYDALNVDAAPFAEPFPFHPHVTLAQQISAEQVPDVFEHARYRWAEFAHKMSFLVDHATFVQAINLFCWVDLEECPLGSKPRP